MLYTHRLYPWTVRLAGLLILLVAYAPSSVPGPGVFEWLYQLGANAVTDALDMGAIILRAEWDSLHYRWAQTGYTGWLTFIAFRIVMAIFRRIPAIYGWPLHKFMSKKLAIDVTLGAIRIGRGGFETDAIGPIAVAPHHAAMEHTTRDQLHRDFGRMPTGKSFYYQNSHNVVLPYHGQPVVIMSMFGSKLLAEQVAARIMMVLNLVRGQRGTAPGGDEFGPAPSLPD